MCHSTVTHSCLLRGTSQSAEVFEGSMQFLCLEQPCYGMLLPSLNLMAAVSCRLLRPIYAHERSFFLHHIFAIDISNICTEAVAAVSTVEAVYPCRELEHHRPVPTGWKDLICSLPLPLRVMVYPDLSKYYSLFRHQQLNQLMTYHTF